MTDTISDQEPVVLLNMALDRTALATQFARAGRLQIHNVLDTAFAEDLFTVFEKSVPWSVVFNEGKNNVELTPQQLKTLPQSDQMRQMQGINSRARNSFQFLYNSFMILNSYQKNEYPDHPLYFLLEYINGEEFLELVREVTGIPELIKADAQATLFRPGHFLTRHDDSDQKQESRRVAFVLGFAKDWRADWGGLLHFFEDDSETIDDTFVPGFNVLSLFRVPTPHAVSMVTPFAGAGRYSITGWFQDR